MRGLRFNAVYGIFVIFLFFIFVNISGAKIFEVSTSDHLQASLTEAESNGEDDLIKILQGEYYGNFVYASTEAHSLSLEGGHQADFITRDVDAENTVIDGEGNGAVLVLSAPDVAANFAIDGLTLQNGNVRLHGGGGIYITTDRGNITISNSIISANSVQSHSGGGIYIYGSMVALISDNVISSNSSGSNGGGVYFLNNVEINMSNNIIASNSSGSGYTNDGGGVYIENSSSVTLNNNQIIGNEGSYAGGGGKLDASYTILENNTISNNSSKVGGGIWLTGNPAILKNNIISDNVASDVGGGVYSRGNPSIIMKNVISNNKCIDRGGGGIVVYNDGSVDVINNIITNNMANYGAGVEIGTPDILNMINNTITNNVAADKGGGTYVWLHEDIGELANIYNNTILNNSALNGGDIYINNDHNNNYIPTPVYLLNNDFDQSEGGIYIQIPFPIDPSNLNNVDPLFVDPLNDDYHLTEGSVLINAGNNLAPELPLTDKDGSPRKVGSAVDIGAYEYQGFVEPIAAFTGSPLSGVAPLTVNFMDQSTGSIDSWYWDFGDGTDSTLQSTSPTYNVAGIYSVSLTVAGESFSDTDTKADYITVVSPDAPNLSGRVKEFHMRKFGENIVVKIQVENSGNTKADPFDVAFYLSDNGITQDEFLLEKTLNCKLKPGHKKTVRFADVFSQSISGKYIRAEIDSNNDVLELDETNNAVVIRVP